MKAGGFSRRSSGLGISLPGSNAELSLLRCRDSFPHCLTSGVSKRPEHLRPVRAHVVTSLWSWISSPSRGFIHPVHRRPSSLRGRQSWVEVRQVLVRGGAHAGILQETNSAVKARLSCWGESKASPPTLFTQRISSPAGSGVPLPLPLPTPSKLLPSPGDSGCIPPCPSSAPCGSPGISARN